MQIAQILIPLIWMVLQTRGQHTQKGLVKSLDEIVRLRMVQCSVRLFNRKKSTQLCHYFSLKLSALVRVYLFW